MIITSLQGIDVRAYLACCGKQLESVVHVQTEANSLLIEICGSVCSCYTELDSAAPNCTKVYLSLYTPWRRMWEWRCIRHFNLGRR